MCLRALFFVAVHSFILGVYLTTSTPSEAAPPIVSAGFPNTNQTAGDLLSSHMIPNDGRMAIIGYHNGHLFSIPEIPSSAPGSNFQVRGWDINDPSSPQEVTSYGTTSQPVGAHGYIKHNELLVIGTNFGGPWSFSPNGYGSGDVTRTTFPDQSPLFGIGLLGSVYHPWIGEANWSYSPVGPQSIYRHNSLTGQTDLQTTIDVIGETGVIGKPIIIGDLMIIASDQSDTGVATYSISDPTNPVLLDVLNIGVGGYLPEPFAHQGRLYVVWPNRGGVNSIRVVDVTDPTDLVFIGETIFDDSDEMVYVQFQDEYAFTGGHKIDMRTRQSVLNLHDNAEGDSLDTSQFALPLGNLLVTGGIATIQRDPGQGMGIWAHQTTPDTRGPEVAFHIPEVGRQNYPLGAPISFIIHETLESYTIIPSDTLIVRPLGGSAVSGSVTFSYNDVLTFQPDSALIADTTYEVIVVDGGIKDAAGNGIEGYSFTFSTGTVSGGNQSPVISNLQPSSSPAETY